jgi:hypothetical protein
MRLNIAPPGDSSWLGQILVCAWRQGIFSFPFMVILFVWNSICMNNDNINGKQDVVYEGMFRFSCILYFVSRR